MKKWIKGLTVLCATTILYTGCGTSKEDALLEKTQKVYENVDGAYNSVKKYANDIYNGCKAYVLQGENLTVEDFLDETNITEDEMLDAMKAYFVEEVLTMMNTLLWFYYDHFLVCWDQQEWG